MEIVYQSEEGNTRIEKIKTLELVQGEHGTMEQKVVDAYLTWTRLPYRFTFGLIKRWVNTKKSFFKIDSAIAFGSATLFNQRVMNIQPK